MPLRITMPTLGCSPREEGRTRYETPIQSATIAQKKVLAGCAVALATLVAPSGARSATLIVTNVNDSRPGSLRETIAQASSGDTIIFSTERSRRGTISTITLTSGPLMINIDDQ
jgi:hypothetical protein